MDFNSIKYVFLVKSADSAELSLLACSIKYKISYHELALLSRPEECKPSFNFGRKFR